MAKCSFCSEINKKLYKAEYYNKRVYICKYCAFQYEVPLEMAKV